MIHLQSALLPLGRKSVEGAQRRAVNVAEDRNAAGLTVRYPAEAPFPTVLEGVLPTVDPDLVFVRVGPDVCVL